MTAHDHTGHDPACLRCDLSRDETRWWTDEDRDTAGRVMIRRGWGWPAEAWDDMESVLAALAPTVERIRREAKAEALREAAANMPNGVGEFWNPSGVDYRQQRHEAQARRVWLRERADRIEPGDA